MHLQGAYIAHHGTETARCHRVAHSYVQFAYFLRNGVEHGHKHRLVRKHYGSFQTMRSHLLENLGELLCLSHGGRYAKHLYLRLRQGFSQIRDEGLGELKYIVGKEEGGFVVGVLYPFAAVIPAELGYPRIPHLAHQFPFASVERIHSHKNILAGISSRRCEHIHNRLSIKPLSKIPVGHTLIA